MSEFQFTVLHPHQQHLPPLNEKNLIQNMRERLEEQRHLLCAVKKLDKRQGVARKLLTELQNNRGDISDSICTLSRIYRNDGMFSHVADQKASSAYFVLKSEIFCQARDPLATYRWIDRTLEIVVDKLKSEINRDKQDPETPAEKLS